jgi:hypothetical protein
MAEKQVTAINYFLKKWNPSLNTDENTKNKIASDWAYMQYPRGTCIPTTLKVTVN